jgi:hypothetical protein
LGKYGVKAAIRRGWLKVAPPSEERTTDIPFTRPVPGAANVRHDTYTSPSCSTAMSQPCTNPSETILPLEKLTPWSVERAT